MNTGKCVLEFSDVASGAKLVSPAIGNSGSTLTQMWGVLDPIG
jgi:hypothetical protein